MAIDLWKKTWPEWIKTAAWVIAPLLPFLILQLVINRNISGQWFTTPFARYNDVLYHGAFGFHSGAAPSVVSDVPEVQAFYDTGFKGVIEQHTLKNLFTMGLPVEWNWICLKAIADPFFWIILPLSLLAMWNRRFWMVWGMLLVFPLLMSAYAFMWILPHYYVMVMPAMILLGLLPIRFLTDIFPKRTAMIRTMIGLAIIALCAAAMPQFDRIIHDQYFQYPELDQIDHDVDAHVTPPAVVMFHFNRDAIINGKKVSNNPSEEPVYNADVAWPDDAPIIHARDLNADISAVGHPGDRDRPLYEYYSRVAPVRLFYLYNRGGGRDRLTRLGTPGELLRATANDSDLK